MPAKTRTQMRIPALREARKLIIPGFRLGIDVDYRDTYSMPMSAVGYQQFNPPSLSGLRHAYFDKVDGSYVSPGYRQSVLSRRGYGEWTSTWLRDGKEIVERPERIFHDGKRWIAEGGTVIPVELPHNGWALEYNKSTGLPSETSMFRRDAEMIFGDDASYFYSMPDGLRAVLRGSNLYNDGSCDVFAFGPFCVSAGSEPDSAYWRIGARSCTAYRQTRSPVIQTA